MTRLIRPVLSAAMAWLFAIGWAVSVCAQPVVVPTVVTNPVTEEQLAPLTSAYLRAVKLGEAAEAQRALFLPVLQRIQRGYVRDVDMPQFIASAVKALAPLKAGEGEPAQVFGKAINAALATLDPHSVYADPVTSQLQRGSISGRVGGVGIQVDMMDGLVRVVEPTPGLPAARAGLKSGDLIVRFDDQPVQGMTLMEAVARMRGEPGTPIALTVRRAPGEEVFTVALVREVISSPPVRWRLEGDVLVLGISSFTATVSWWIEKAIGEATAEKTPRAVVLDLRGNGGGLLRQAIVTADTFMREGEITTYQGRADSSRRTWRADAREIFPDAPMVVLIDGRSASASELVAAALQENGRATVMGQRSFGKGSVQTTMPLGQGKGSLRLTTGMYYGPSGRSVQRTGVSPDIEIVAAAATANRRREADRPYALPGADEPPPPRASVDQTRCTPVEKNADPVLACAVAFLNAQGIEEFLAAVGQPEAP